MEIFKMLDLSIKHLKESTKEKLNEASLFHPYGSINPEIKVTVHSTYYGWFVYSWLDDTDDEFKKELIEQCAGCEDLVECILYAHKNDCTWILFDNEAKVDRNLPLYEFDTMKICANCSHINIEGTRDPETGYCYHYDCEIDLCDGCDCDYYYGY